MRPCRLGPSAQGKGFRVGAQKDRYEEELLIMGGRFDPKGLGPGHRR